MTPEENQRAWDNPPAPKEAPSRRRARRERPAPPRPTTRPGSALLAVLELHEALDADLRRERRERLAEDLEALGLLSILREYARATGERRSLEIVLELALLDATIAALDARQQTSPGHRSGRRGRTKNGRGASGAKGPDATATARRRVPSRPIGRHVDG